MPILDPKLQYSLLLRFPIDQCKGFFIKYLKIASSNLNRNINAVKAHILFQKDLLKNIGTINKLFDCKISIQDNKFINNYFQFLYDNIDTFKENEIQNDFVLFSKNDFLFYNRINDLSQLGQWILTNSSLAIFSSDLTYDSKDINSYEIKKRLGILNLEFDLMLASGFTLAFICRANHETADIAKEFINNTLKDHFFSEIHFTLDFTSSIKEKTKYEKVLDSLLQNIDSIKGYFYLYMPFVSEIKSCQQILNKLKENFLFQVINYAKEFDEVFQRLQIDIMNSFPYYEDGFSCDVIRICLSNVALYDSDDEQSDFAMSAFSEISYGFIKKDDFLNFNKERVRIIMGDGTTKYCDFDDLHIIKPDLYVEDTMYLMEVDQNELDRVEKIIENADSIYQFTNKKYHLLNETKKMEKYLAYIAAAFYDMTYNNKQINLRPNQVFAALEACSMFCNDKVDKSKKGYVYQVHTGEGKSYIIQTIAACQAMMGKTVHIATSNIFLANRDYHDSYKFFKFLGLKSCVLLHKSEIPEFPTNENENTKTKKNDDDDIEFGDEIFQYKRERYPSTFFGDELFENSSGMNIGVCGAGFGNTSKQTANIIYSTFINFEAFYLRLLEMNPNAISKYFQNSILLIDEADSILIDELTNGTILSRPMNTNGKEILVYVYQCKMQNLKPIDVLNGIKTVWPKCTDMNEDDIIAMYKEIDLVQTMNFIDGKKYCVELIDIDHTKKENIINKVLQKIEDIKEKVGNIKETVIDAPIRSVKESIRNTFGKLKKKKKDLNRSKTQANIETVTPTLVERTQSVPTIEPTFHYGRSEEEKNEQKQVKVNYIIPFDYDNKGILEPNKEFNGFIQQFIAIKEMFSNPDEYKNMFIKDVSMSYLYVSHPIFVQLYSGVCGLTGTLGGSHEEKIFAEQYKLNTLKIPRSGPNKRVDIATVLCRDINVRNKRIVGEAIQYQKQGTPVLVIFQDLNEISIVYRMLRKKGVKYVNVFDGKDQSIKPDHIAGRKSAISLGTNVCGRGTDIKDPAKPLHVIITYYTLNVRVMQQAYGRTGRKGTFGSVHIICTTKQYFEPLEIVKGNNLNHVLNDFVFKNKLQMEFIDSFKKSREWIFTPITKSQKLDSKTIGELRNAKINVNRVIAYKYKFPLCLSIDTFLMIQAQKIFSLFNCPNCMYTWQLFQRYIREMIFESWSLFNDQIERHFINAEYDIKTKEKYTREQYNLLLKKINNYIPNNSNLSIVETYMYIYNKVVRDWQDKIFSYIPKNISCIPFKQTNTNRFISFNIGFKPYSLVNGSGARIAEVNEGDDQPDFISDPELTYIRQEQKSGKFISVSITEAIDKLFNKVCLMLNDIIGAYIGVKFFLRRTLGGCEFGICFDLELKNEDEDLIKENCLVDRDPLLVFTISIKSVAPLLAGILIFGLVYLASISATIAEFITAFPQKFSLEIAKRTMKKLIKDFISNTLQDQMKEFCNKIISFLELKLAGMIVIIDTFNSIISNTLRAISKIISTASFDQAGESINNVFQNTVHFNINSQLIQGLTEEGLPVAEMVKIGITLILCLAAFLVNFNNQKRAIAQSKEEKNAADFDKNHSKDEKVEELMEKNKKAYNEKDHIPLD